MCHGKALPVTCPPRFSTKALFQSGQKIDFHGFRAAFLKKVTHAKWDGPHFSSHSQLLVSHGASDAHRHSLCPYACELLRWAHGGQSAVREEEPEDCSCSSHSAREFQCPECGRVCLGLQVAYLFDILGFMPHERRHGWSRARAASSEAWDPGQGALLSCLRHTL